MDSSTYDLVIVGSGAGGATLARELSRQGKQVLILEQGRYEESIGTFLDCTRYTDVHKLTKMPPRSTAGVILWRTLMAGGSTMISAANGTPCLEAELADLGINISQELDDLKAELNIRPYHPRRLSSASREIQKSALELGFKMDPMPKFLDPKKCRRCGECTLGCKYNAKWTALNFLEEALAQDADIRYGCCVEKVLHHNGQVTGLEVNLGGRRERIEADLVILSAGGIGTPLILKESGLEQAGNHLFLDLFVTVYGLHPDLDQSSEPQMALVHHGSHKQHGFILSPYINQSRPVRFLELGMKGFLLPTAHLLGIMVKIKDSNRGRIINQKKFEKSPTPDDRIKLDKGIQAAREILIKCGVDPTSILISDIQGAHPGGTAAIGEIVDHNFQTEIKNLYVCDGSILPESPGLPPIMTIAALAKHLAAYLN
jgi:choline dehydrogenase-like flavoprotein